MYFIRHIRVHSQSGQDTWHVIGDTISGEFRLTGTGRFEQDFRFIGSMHGDHLPKKPLKKQNGLAESDGFVQRPLVGFTRRELATFATVVGQELDP